MTDISEPDEMPVFELTSPVGYIRIYASGLVVSSNPMYSWTVNNRLPQYVEEQIRKRDAAMSDWKPYRRMGITEMMPWTPETPMAGVSISNADAAAGSPKAGDYIARNVDDRTDQWLVSASFFAKSGFEVVEDQT